jgi:hypothetical protein
MADRQLSTRDLAGTSDTTATDVQGDTEQTDTRQPLGETPADEPLMRERGESEEDDRSPSDEHGETAPANGGAGPRAGEQAGTLLPADQGERFTTRWEEIQTSFVDRPREAVEQADALVADLMQRVAATFSNERQRLESQWDRGDDVSTEELRVALTRYRSFFDRLLSA